ncbi:MAG: T9SS type A sorting domain-containing protein [Burkholderiales bacterium]|nr:T9SS type A sorting domain-containing protein [Bacteroidia bacterium]
MKKQLLFGFAAFAALAVTAQNSSRILTNPKVKKMVTFKSFTKAEPTNNLNTPVTNGGNKAAAAPYKRIGGSTNAYGIQSTEGRALTYNEAINTIGMVHRKQAGWTVTNGNSGTIVYAYSINGGTSWDSTVVSASASLSQRHPGGTIFNPAGNTTPAGAYAVVSGPGHVGAVNWGGNYFGSKQLSFPGNNSNGSVVYTDNTALTGGQRKQVFARGDMQATTDGKVHVLGGLFGDINATTAAGQAFRGAMLNTGTFNAGSFTWTSDSLKPNFKVDNAGDAQGYTSFNQAWSENGVTGYLIFDGVDANSLAGTPMNAYQPYVYKTVNSGATWSRFAPLFDFSSIPAIGGRIYATGGTTTPLAKPWVSTSEGSCATVDANGNLHFLATFGSAASDNIDSLGYTYNVDFVSVWNYITDFNTTANGWCATVIDSLKTDGPLAANSNWTSSGGGVGMDARLQISRTTNGQKIIYSWADSDPVITQSTFNTQPNIKMKGYDMATSMYTATKDMSAAKAGAEYYSFWFLSSPIIANPSVGNWLVPTIYTASDDASLNGDNPVSYYYMDDNMFTAADFNTLAFGGCTPTGVKHLTDNTFENVNFYPNPTSNNGTIDVQLNATAKLDIAILNSVGQTVYSTSVFGNIGSNKIDLNLNNLSSGLYFYQVKVGNSKAITKKFAVEK